MKILTPCPQEIIKYNSKWDSNDTYSVSERSLTKLFLNTYPKNNKIDEVLVKVCSLNNLYSTNIFAPHTVAIHILALKLDEKLKDKDLIIVNEMAKVEITPEKSINFYSFATKYCSHHDNITYPIYDRYVEKMLLHFRDTDGFCKFRRKELKIFPNFKNILEKFQKHYQLDEFSLKQIDKYLFMAGKAYFPINYK